MIIHSFGDRPSIPTLHHGGSVSLTTVASDDGEITFIESLPHGKSEKHQIKRDDFICGKLSHVVALTGSDEMTLVVGTVEAMRSLQSRVDKADSLIESHGELQEKCDRLQEAFNNLYVAQQSYQEVIARGRYQEAENARLKEAIAELQTSNQGLAIAHREEQVKRQSLLAELEGLKSDRSLLLNQIDELREHIQELSKPKVVSLDQQIDAIVGR